MVTGDEATGQTCDTWELCHHKTRPRPRHVEVPLPGLAPRHGEQEVLPHLELHRPGEHDHGVDLPLEERGGAEDLQEAPGLHPGDVQHRGFLRGGHGHGH